MGPAAGLARPGRGGPGQPSRAGMAMHRRGDPAMEADAVDDLERALKALANRSRIRLLLALQDPQRMTEIDLRPSRGGPWGSRDRAISRQAVRRHLRELQALGVVQELAGGESEVRYVVNHARVYEVTERLRELATVKPRVALEGKTLGRDATGARERPRGPHLVLVRGVREGQTFPLADQPVDGWLIGRAAPAHVVLDYDPYVSSAHARILLQKGGHFLADLPGNRNGTFLNWEPMIRGGVAPLQSGDLLGVGMSLLLYRA